MSPASDIACDRELNIDYRPPRQEGTLQDIILSLYYFVEGVKYKLSWQVGISLKHAIQEKR